MRCSKCGANLKKIVDKTNEDCFSFVFYSPMKNEIVLGMNIRTLGDIAKVQYADEKKFGHDMEVSVFDKTYPVFLGNMNRPSYCDPRLAADYRYKFD